MPGILLAGLAAPLHAAEVDLPAASCATDSAGLSAEQLLAITADWTLGGRRYRAPIEFATTPNNVEAAGEQSVLLAIGPPPARVAAADWQSAIFIAAARRTNRPEIRVGVRATVDTREAKEPPGATQVRVQVPPNLTGWFGERWLLAVAVCGASTNALVGYGVAEVAVNPKRLSIGLAAMLILGIYGLTAGAAWRCNAGKLQRRWAEEALRRGLPPAAGRYERDRLAAYWARIAWKLRRAIDPVFVSQDASGTGSLSRLQIVLFSVAVGFVSLNIFFATGAIAALSNDVLWLLGITVLASGFARLVPSNAGLSTSSKLWLAQRKVLLLGDNLPIWRDIVAADGEIDVTRVQAVIFTAVTLLALMITGFGDLSHFRVPSEVQYLLGLSQIAYVAGKALPTESLKQLDQSVKQLREADAAAAAPEADEAAQRRYRQTLEATAPLLSDIFSERFREEEFLRMRPGRAAA